MAKTLAAIQTLVRNYADDKGLTITSGTNLEIANLVYRALCRPGGGSIARPELKFGRRWPELIRVNTSLATVDSQESYTVTETTDPVFISGEWVLERLENSQTYSPVVIHPVTDEEEWSELGRVGKGTPEKYRLRHDGTNLFLDIRPLPTRAEPLRRTGLIQPTDLSQSSTTVFRLAQVDDAYAKLVAAEIQEQRDNAPKAAALRTAALAQLPAQPEAISNRAPQITPYSI